MSPHVGLGCWWETNLDASQEAHKFETIASFEHVCTEVRVTKVALK